MAELVNGNAATILCVDDETNQLVLRKLLLENAGYRVLTAADGLEAHRLFLEQQGALRLLITDTAMPGMDGPLLIASVRALSPALPIILSSGHGEAAPDSRNGITVLSKPFSLIDLLTAVAESLSKSSRCARGMGLGNR